MPSKLLPFHDLSERHSGVTEALGRSLTEAACVCLDRHHAPAVEFEIRSRKLKESAQAKWSVTNDRTRRAWANQTDATENGACAIALAAVELVEGKFAFSRAETLTGADYYIAPAGSVISDLENSIRLEVSGLDSGDEYSISQRLKTKIKQALNGASNLPAIAAVVGFRARIIAIAPAEEK